MKNLNQVHLNGLRAVEAVARLGSLQAAAEELGVSIGAVSQQVIKTEQQLGRPLFERTSRGMVPVETATDVLARLSDGFRHLSGALALARRSDDSLLTISVAPVFAARWLVHRIAAFSERFPEIGLRIDANDRLTDAIQTDLDLRIRVGRGHWPGFKAELILEQRIAPLCTPAMAATLAKPSDILDLPKVIDGRAMFTWDVWLSAVGLAGAEIRARHTFSEASLCLDAAIAGQGVMLAWQTIASHQLQHGQLVAPFGPAVKTGFGHYFVTAENARRSDKVEKFKRWLKREIEEDMERLAKAAPVFA
ncbi:DNA-binding transcriptional LysR family regulator [Peteryoungia aggregata LMG 23059]|uniref:DNA-binding transcriptional LysR family regulator n=1 Tax=Peteryoungia aggregata LMG 23059 TaxID=1368425 RepID=A0ABU0G438_9HYPH|nr:LysR substrate-binding domain-containing protein [Peteryoungia aggregata]MDQ0420077.1 DNA-binding transcriptional LysR family regulator [Peteryoungia aggregata LMG 23059]